MTAIEGAGTSEDTWAPWTAAAPWPVADPDRFSDPLVIAPHPDDEILGVGGLLAQVGRADIVAVTDGEGSHPHADERTRAAIAARRPVETDNALIALGGHFHVERLRHADGGIDEDALAESLAGLLRPGRACLATWRGDGHPDHEAVGRAAARACDATGARLWEYPVWMWHWSRPGDPRVPWERAHRLLLPPAVGAAKSAAIDAFITQITPIDGVTILPAPVLARFRRPFEVMFG